MWMKIIDIANRNKLKMILAVKRRRIMSVLDTKNKRKSAGITIAALLVLLYLIFNYGMDYIDPPVEYGIAINYGISDQGRTQPKVVENVKVTPKPLTNLQEVKRKLPMNLSRKNSLLPKIRGSFGRNFKEGTQNRKAQGRGQGRKTQTQKAIKNVKSL